MQERDEINFQRLNTALTRLAPRLGGRSETVCNLRKLQGGASQQLWGFALGDPQMQLVLRQAPLARRSGGAGLGLTTEANVMKCARQSGVPVPEILLIAEPNDGLGDAYVMSHVAGETLPKRIRLKPEFRAARDHLCRDLGSALAAIHSTPTEHLPLQVRSPLQSLTDLQQRLRATGNIRPVFEIVIQELRRLLPSDSEPNSLVHGDFRMGNLMFSPDGLAAVLDWELSFIGDRHADLGWLCMESWRFGGDAEVGGIGQRDRLFAAYERAGGALIDPARVRWWEIWAALAWGVICNEMGVWVREGQDTTVERHVIARRGSETELILLNALSPRNS